MLCEAAVTSAFARSTLAFGWRKIFTLTMPSMPTVVDSMCSMLSTSVVRTFSYTAVRRPSNSAAFMPV
jgi:hypothetical protein